LTCLQLVLGGFLGGIGFWLEELDEVIKSSATVVVLHLGAFTSWEEFEGGESLDLDIFEFVSGGVRLGDDDVSVILVLLTELVPDWGKGFAVSAPWGVELDEDVLGGVEDEVVEVLSDDNLDGVVGVVWDVFGLEVSGNGAIEDTVDEGLDSGGGDVVGFWGILGHVLLHVDDSHGWAVLISDAEEFHDSLVVLNIAVDKDEEKLALELLGGLGEVGDDGVVVGGGLGGEEEVVLLEVTTEDLGGSLVGEFVDEGELLSSDEGDEFFLGSSSEVGALVVEVLEESDLAFSNVEGLGGISIENTKVDIVEGVSGSVENSIIGSNKTNNNDFVVISEFLGGFGTVDWDAGWARLLGHPRDDLVRLSATFVVNWGRSVRSLEPFESWVSTNTEFLGELTVDGGIDLDKENFGTVAGELLSGLGVFWGEGFAVAAPRGVELDENVSGSLEDIVEVVSTTDDDAFLLFEFGANAHKGDQSEKLHSVRQSKSDSKMG